MEACQKSVQFLNCYNHAAVRHHSASCKVYPQQLFFPRTFFFRLLVSCREFERMIVCCRYYSSEGETGSCWLVQLGSTSRLYLLRSRQQSRLLLRWSRFIVKTSRLASSRSCCNSGYQQVQNSCYLQSTRCHVSAESYYCTVRYNRVVGAVGAICESRCVDSRLIKIFTPSRYFFVDGWTKMAQQQGLRYVCQIARVREQLLL